MGYTVTMQVCITPNKHLKTNRIFAHLNSAIIWAAFFHMRLLKLGEYFWWQDDPINSDHGSSLQSAFEIRIYIIPLHRG